MFFSVVSWSLNKKFYLVFQTNPVWQININDLFRLVCSADLKVIQSNIKASQLLPLWSLKYRRYLLNQRRCSCHLPLTVKCHVDVNQSVSTETIVNIKEASQGQDFGARPFSEFHIVGLALICLLFNFGRENNLGSPGRVTGLCCRMGVGGYTHNVLCFVHNAFVSRALSLRANLVTAAAACYERQSNKL